jgi:hypothetical protein
MIHPIGVWASCRAVTGGIKRCTVRFLHLERWILLLPTLTPTPQVEHILEKLGKHFSYTL